MSYQFGIECEVSSGAADVLTHLYNGGHVSDDHLHAYHCDCNACDHHRSGPDWTGQEDCTADGEFVSRILTTGPEGDAALEAISAALIAGRASHSERVGMHVHTDAGPFREDNDALVRMWRLWLTYQDDVGILARSHFSDVRSYNGPNVTKPHGGQPNVAGVLGYENADKVDRFFEAPPDEAVGMLEDWTRRGPRTGRWLSGGVDSGTFEFRLWNGTRSLWRIRMAVYVSVALTTAALDGYEARPGDGKSLLDAIGDRLPDDVYMSVVKQLASTEGL